MALSHKEIMQTKKTKPLQRFRCNGFGLPVSEVRKFAISRVLYFVVIAGA